MSEILKEAFARPNALTQNRNYGIINQSDWPKYIWEFHPLAQTYYHEFNPYFVHIIKNEDVIPEFRIFTVRDGAYAFADFLLKHAKELPKWKTTFLVPDTYSPLIPENLRSRFFSYSTSQSQKPDIKKAKKVTIFGLLCDQYFGSYENLEKKLSLLKDLPKDVPVEVCLAPRKNPFSLEEKENLHFLHIPDLIRKSLGNREIRWIRVRDIFEKTVLRDHLLIDLLDGHKLTCDSYLHYWWISMGGTVNLIPERKNEQTLFDLDISFNQRLHVKHLPEGPSQFAELLFMAKTIKVELTTLPLFQMEVDKALRISGK